MARIISKPLTQTFEIDDWSVSLAQLTEGDFIELGDLEGKRDVLFDVNGRFAGYRQEINRRRSERRGIYKTMVSCTLQWEDGSLLFDSKDGRVKTAMSEQEFNQQWDLLPQEYTDTIVEKFYEVNPTLAGG